MKNCLAVQYDDRAKLGWPGRFADVASVAVNFYSTGDEGFQVLTFCETWRWAVLRRT